MTKLGIAVLVAVGCGAIMAVAAALGYELDLYVGYLLGYVMAVLFHKD